MGITQLIDDYYVTEGLSTNAALLKVGQLGWAPIPHVTGSPHIVDGIRAEPTGHQCFSGTVRRVREDDYRRRKELPLKLLGLRATERLLVARSKRRPCVILAIKHAVDHPEEGQKHLRRTTLLVAPAFHAQAYEGDSGIPPQWMAEIKALKLPWFFPLKEKPGAPYIQEGAVRLDHAVPLIPGDKGAFSPMPVALSAESLAVLLEQTRTVFGGPISDELAVFKDICESCLP